MRKKKRTAMIAAFALGAFLFAGTALADILDKSGYDLLKDAIKGTAANCTENYQSFTLDLSMAIKDNGQVIVSESNVLKYDGVKGMREETSRNEDNTRINQGNRNRSYGHYSYSDKDQSITKSDNEDKYIVTTYKDGKDERGLVLDKEDNPFNEDGAKDLERILDILVGNLKDQVMVTENPDGSKSFSGHLSEAQIPAIINAVASFQMKQEFNGNRMGETGLTSDVYVKEVMGTAKVNQDGALESILGSGVISGKDKRGTVHEISMEILCKISDINATKIVKPDLTGKNVITKEARDFARSYQPTPEKFVGTFKNDMIMEKDGKFIKVGERILEITSLNKQYVQGNYREELKEGFEKYANKNSAYTFKARFNDKDADANNANFEGTNASGDTINGNIHFNGHDAQIYLHLDQGYYGDEIIYNGDFRPNFE